MNEKVKSIKTVFEKSAIAKSSLAENVEFQNHFERAIGVLLKTRADEGTIFCIGDPEFREKANHLSEELRVRYRAGAKFNRPDRSAIRSEIIYGDSPSDIKRKLSHYIKSDPKSVVVVFCGTGSEALESLLVCRENDIPSIVLAPTRNRSVVDIAAISLEVPTGYNEIISSIYSACIHALCEGFEPESNWKNGGGQSVGSLLAQSAKFDDEISQSNFIHQIVKVRQAMERRLINGRESGAVYFCGNGGSACDAMEFTRKVEESSPSHDFIRAHHLLDPGCFSCAVNDNHSPFKRAVETMIPGKDVIVGLSTSGNSVNILDAFKLANERDVLTIALTGGSGGKLIKESRYALVAPSEDTGRIQEIHAIIGRLLLQ